MTKIEVFESYAGRLRIALEEAERTPDPRLRAELTALADTFLRLTKYQSIDLTAILVLLCQNFRCPL
jgi:hypothetical protein